jgi:hypothetical protein
MNAITYPRIVHDEASARARLWRCEVDMHLGIILELVGDELGALYAPRLPLDAQDADRASRLRRILVTVRDARDCNAANMRERV